MHRERERERKRLNICDDRKKRNPNRCDLHTRRRKRKYRIDRKENNDNTYSRNFLKLF